MRILVLNRDYPGFLDQLYEADPSLREASYAEQMEARNRTLFGVADFYSRGFAANGHEAREIHVNNAWLQAAWAREHRLPGRLAAPSPPTRSARRRNSLAKGIVRRIARPLRRFLVPRLTRVEAFVLAAQIEEFRPHVILNQEMAYVRSTFLRRVKTKDLLIVGQIASALPAGERYTAYDLVVSSLPNLVDWFRGRRVRAELNRLAFDATVLDRVARPQERDIPVSFVGSLSMDHRSRIELLEALATRVGLQLWGSGIEQLPKTSPLRGCYRGEAWGRAMYDVMLRSRITINHHIDLAAGNANNMRLYEATGCGALMLVDAARNLGDIFEPGREVIPYSGPDECAALAQRFLSEEPARRDVAQAAQRRTLHEHTYVRRTAELAALMVECGAGA